MLQIAVCSDEAALRDYLEEKSSEYVECSIHSFQNTKELLESGKEFDLLLLKSEDGQETELTVQIRHELLAALDKNAGEGFSQKDKEPLLIRANGSYYRIEKEKILYVENVGRKVALHMRNSQIAYYAKMKEVEELLGDQFFRCHRGYLVNFKAVKGYETGSILLKNGERILMAKQKYNDFAEAYANYLRKKE